MRMRFRFWNREFKSAPKRPDLLAALGQSYFMAGKTDKAIEEFKKLVELEHSARSYAFLGLSYRNLGRFDEAKKYFQQGLKLDPHSASCLFNLGFIAERQGDAAEAESMFQADTAIKSRTFPTHCLELANLRIAEKRLQEAEDLLRRYVKVSQRSGHRVLQAGDGREETASKRKLPIAT